MISGHAIFSTYCETEVGAPIGSPLRPREPCRQKLLRWDHGQPTGDAGQHKAVDPQPSRAPMHLGAISIIFAAALPRVPSLLK